jgi:di/tricarboxylate transporter
VSGDAWITAGTLLAVLVALATNRFPPSAIVLGATTGLLVVGVIDADEAFAGFSNPAPITVAALYVLARAARKTGLLAPVTARLLGDHTGASALVRLTIPVAGASAFLNNTPLVAMLMGDVVGWAKRKRTSASRFLLPLSYAAILGGTVTVLGTSTNLVVSGLLEQRGLGGFSLFEVTRVGLPAAVAGLVVIVIGAPRLLPERLSAQEQVETQAREFVVAMEVVAGGSIDGQSVAGAGLRDLDGVYLVEIERGAEVITPPNPDVVLRGDDVLTFAGRIDEILDLQRRRGLRSTEQEHVLAVDRPGHTFFEAVIGRSSLLAGQTLKQARFRSRYQGAVVAIHRDGQRVDAKLGEVVLRPTDTLLVLARPGFAQRWRANTDFLTVAHIGGEAPTSTRKAPIVGAAAAAIVLLAAFDVMPILHGALLAAAALIATRVLSFSEARDAIDLDVILLIGAAFGLGAAIEVTGLAEEVAEGFTDALGGFGTVGLVLGIVLATSLLTELVTNNAAAVVVLPIALSIAGPAGLDPRAIAVAVAVTASASFLTPIGYQTNTMVYGPGGYRFTDYLRLGIPLNLVVMATITASTVAIA